MGEIIFENLTKRFGKINAVNNFNLTIKDKEFLTLVGPSGCGKSTTLNILAGLEDPTDGYIYIDGKLANVIPPGKRNIAMVFQSYALYPHMDVFNNISFGLKVRGMRKAEIIKKVNEAAQLLDIEELLYRKPGELSGGQRQRVALGRAIVRNPAVFLLDEPLSNLDAKLRIQMRADLRLLFKRLETTVVYVTHDQAEAMTLSDRIVIMKDGLIQQIGKPEEVYDNPRNLFVAGFLGSPNMNFIKCSLYKSEDISYVKTENFKIKLTNDQVSKIKGVSSTNNLIMGIRPEDVILEKENYLINCDVEVIENMGSNLILYFKIGTERIIAVTDRNFTNLNTLKECKISFDLNKFHLFDEKNGNALF
jgi:multiple sugar transport system ATP-binding protein